MEIEFGKCKTCRHRWCDYFDPSEAGVSLSPGAMVDSGCLKEDELYEKYPDCGTKQYGEDTECPLWELWILRYCEHHNKWVFDECTECEYDEEQKLKEHEKSGLIKLNFEVLGNGTFKCKFCGVECKNITDAELHWNDENR